MVMLLVALLFGIAAGPASAFERVGVVLLHGKTGSPNQFSGMAETMRETGYAVEAPEMCWSNRRIYDAALNECMEDVDAAIARLRADGFTRIVVGGHSLGGLVALAYAASHEGLAGVVALAPDGEPTDFNGHAKVARSVTKAEAMVKAGNGDDEADFTDRVLGRDLPVTTTAVAFLSFLGPESVLVPSRLLPKLRAPLFWAAGSKDSSQRNAATAFKRASANRLNTLVPVNAGHMGTPGAALVPLLDWLDRIAEE